MERPSIVIVGAGLIGARHVEQAAQQAQLCAIVDPADAARDLAERFKVPHFDTVEDCLDQMRPDGAVIATPNSLHEAHALPFLKAGVPLLIEKPLADTVESADRILAALEQSGTPVLVGHHRRHNPIIQRAKADIDAGRLGTIVAITGQFWLYKPDDYFEANWRAQPGAGPLMINLIHDVDLLRYLCGDIVEVQSMRSNATRGFTVEDTAAVLLRFANGALGTFSLSDTAAAPWSWEMSSAENPIYPHTGGACYTIGGTHGALSIPDLKLWSHDDQRGWWCPISSEDRSVPVQDAFALQFTHFLDVIAGAHPLVSARDGRESLAVVLQAVETKLEPSP